MELNFDSYPLNVYNEATSKAILDEIKFSENNQPIINTILTKLVKHYADLGLANIMNKALNWFRFKLAQLCLENMISNQVELINKEPSILHKEAQHNLIVTTCLAGNLLDFDSNSIGKIIEFSISAVSALIKGRANNEFNLSIAKIYQQYDYFGKIYYIAFLLNVYKTNPQLGGQIKTLITEALSFDAFGKSLLINKNMPILFSGVKYKTADDNLTHRLTVLEEEQKRNVNQNFVVFVNWRRKFNEDLNRKSCTLAQIKVADIFICLSQLIPEWEEKELIKYVDIYDRLKNNLEWGDNRIKSYILLFNRIESKHKDWNDEKIRIYLDRFYRIKYETGWDDKRIERYLELKGQRIQ